MLQHIIIHTCTSDDVGCTNSTPKQFSQQLRRPIIVKPLNPILLSVFPSVSGNQTLESHKLCTTSYCINHFSKSEEDKIYHNEPLQLAEVEMSTGLQNIKDKIHQFSSFLAFSNVFAPRPIALINVKHVKS